MRGIGPHPTSRAVSNRIAPLDGFSPPKNRSARLHRRRDAALGHDLVVLDAAAASRHPPTPDTPQGAALLQPLLLARDGRSGHRALPQALPAAARAARR